MNSLQKETIGLFVEFSNSFFNREAIIERQIIMSTTLGMTLRRRDSRLLCSTKFSQVLREKLNYVKPIQQEIQIPSILRLSAIDKAPNFKIEGNRRLSLKLWKSLSLRQNLLYKTKHSILHLESNKSWIKLAIWTNLPYFLRKNARRSLGTPLT